ncbi:MAG: hypothetical protein ABIG11_02405 [bacterium]
MRILCLWALFPGFIPSAFLPQTCAALSAERVTARSPAKYHKASSVKWLVKSSSHFKIHHQSAWAPSGLTLELEKIHGRMRAHMAMFAPWMAVEKVGIYVYSSRRRYLAGEFSPPQWSKGIANYRKKLIAVYDTGDRGKLTAVITHELAHLFFESFYGEASAVPPPWLSEGLAVMMEDAASGRKADSPWSSALKSWSPKRIIPLDVFFNSRVEESFSKQQVENWYLQAYGMVKYLYAKHGMRLSFIKFCRVLRDGEQPEKALSEVYKVRSLRDLEKEWTAWIVRQRTAGKAGVSLTGPQFGGVRLPGFLRFNFNSPSKTKKPVRKGAR